MKKMLVCCVAFLFFAAFANAAVNVEIGGKTKKYPDGSILKIAAKKKTVVKYSNFNIVIPRGSNFIMDCESDMVTFKGKFDKPVKLNSYTLSTNFENNDFSVTTDGNVKVNEGSVEITDEQNNVAIATSGGAETKLDMPAEKYVDDASDDRIYVMESEDRLYSKNSGCWFKSFSTEKIVKERNW